MADPTARRAVYKRGTYPGQVDHPGWLSMVVEDAAALDAAILEGWRTSMTDDLPAPVVDPEFDAARYLPPGWGEPSAPKKRGRKPKVAD